MLRRSIALLVALALALVLYGGSGSGVARQTNGVVASVPAHCEGHGGGEGLPTGGHPCHNCVLYAFCGAAHAPPSPICAQLDFVAAASEAIEYRSVADFLHPQFLGSAHRARAPPHSS